MWPCQDLDRLVLTLTTLLRLFRPLPWHNSRGQSGQVFEITYYYHPSSSSSFIHLGHFYSASSSPLLLRGAPDTARILYQSFTPKRHMPLRVKDLPKVPTWRLERDSNQRLSG